MNTSLSYDLIARLGIATSQATLTYITLEYPPF